jgi:hypothetical protein
MTIEGITVFPDHADPGQFWYLPGPISLARRREDRRAALTFIKYKPAAVAGGAKGGGFLTFEVNLRIDPELERRILARVSAIAKGRPRLAVVPFDEGTVQCVALNLQGGGGTAATPAGPGTFNAVERILGASVPSLHGDNSASFSLTLSQEGATIVEQAFREGTTPVGVIYDLKFTGMRPALDVKITADFKRIYTHFSAGLAGQIYFVKAAIDVGFEKLVQDGAIKIEVTNFTGEADLAAKEQWALDFFKEKLLADWFHPTLTPGQLAGGMAQPESLAEVLKRGNELRPPATPPPPPPAASAEPAPAATSTPAASDAARPTAASGLGDEAAGAVRPPAVAPAAAGDSPTAGSGSPAVPTERPPLARAGLGSTSDALASAASALSRGTSGGMPAVISVSVKFIRQEELKTVTLEYHRSEATRRTYAPQGFFGLLVADLDKKNHFVEVDLDDPFFRIVAVTADAPIDFQQIGLTSVHVSLDYGDPTDATSHKHGDFVFDAQNRGEKKFEVFMNARRDTAYTCQVQYHFDPASGWEGQRFSYEMPAKKGTEDRTLLVNPFEHLGFLDVRIFPNHIDRGVVESTDVHVKYAGPSGWSREKVFVVKPDSAPQFWKLRLSDPMARSYTYRFVHHLKDGTTRATEPVITQAAAIPVDDPFEGALEIEFVPLLNPQKVRMAFVDVEYDDPENNYRRDERLRIAGNAVDPVALRISIVDGAKRTFRYRLTIVGTDSQMRRGPQIDTSETLIAVSE